MVIWINDETEHTENAATSETDAPEAPETPRNVKLHRQICDGLSGLYAAKNADYGDSFSESCKEFGLTAAAVRIGDKYRRFCNLIQNPAKVSDESIRDTLLDLANYAIMTVVEIDSGSAGAER